MIEIPDLRKEGKKIKDFHYLLLPILNPKLQLVDKFSVPEFHWKLYSDFDSEYRLQLSVAPVGFAKSTILKIWGLKEFLENKDTFILYVSSTHTKATDQFGAIKKVLEQDFLQFIYKYKILTSNESEIVVEFEDQIRQKFQALGSGADISGINFEGIRPSLILIDDLEELEQARSKDRTDKLQEWLLTTLISRLPSLKEGRVRMINTVLTTDSLTNRILGKGISFDKTIFNDWHTAFYQALSNGRSVWEEQHPTELLLKDQELRPHIFASNYMNEPLDLNNALIKFEDLRFYDFIDLDDFTWLYMHADLTQTSKDTSDYFCLTIVGESFKDHNIYLIDFILQKLDIEKQARRTIVMYQKYNEKIKKLTYDEKGNQGFGFWIKKLAKEEYDISIPATELKYPSDKVTHFMSHQPHFTANRIYLPKLHKDLELATTQLLSFPSKGVNDDFVDGLSGALDNFLKFKVAEDRGGYTIKIISKNELNEEFNEKN